MDNKGKDKAKKLCVYGSLHPHCDCFNPNKSYLPAHWIPQPETQDVIAEKLAKEEKLQSQFEWAKLSGTPAKCYLANQTFQHLAHALFVTMSG